MVRTILLAIILLPLPVFSQQLIGKDKAYVKKFLEQEKARHDSLDITITQNDSVMVYEIKPGKTKAATFSYRFDKDGRCHSEKVKASCSDCIQQYLQNALAQKKYGWKKINENQYVSAYKHKLMIELSVNETDFSFYILRASWTKKLYKILLE